MERYYCQNCRRCRECLHTLSTPRNRRRDHSPRSVIGRSHFLIALELVKPPEPALGLGRLGVGVGVGLGWRRCCSFESTDVNDAIDYSSETGSALIRSQRCHFDRSLVIITALIAGLPSYSAMRHRRPAVICQWGDKRIRDSNLIVIIPIDRPLDPPTPMTL